MVLTYTLYTYIIVVCCERKKQLKSVWPGDVAFNCIYGAFGLIIINQTNFNFNQQVFYFYIAC